MKDNSFNDKLRAVSFLDVFLYLMRYSSENSPLSCNEIAMGLSDEYYYMLEKNRDFILDSELNELDRMRSDIMKYRKEDIPESIRRQVERILSKYDSFEMPFGRICMLSDEFASGSRKDHFTRVYYAESVFTESQINLLRDAISVYPYAEQNVTASIIDGLNSLTPLYNREPYNKNKYSAKKYPGSYFKNLEIITQAFSKKIYSNPDNITTLTPAEREMNAAHFDKQSEKGVSKIRFKYCEYNEEKKLVVRPDKHGNEIREVNPLKLMWVNGYYYLVTLLAEEHSSRCQYINYRVDKMIDVECLDEKAAVVSDFSVEEYKYSHPVMYADNRPIYEKQNIIIKCKKKLINNALDTFGFNINIAAGADAAKYGYSSLSDDEVIIDLGKAGLEGVCMWALEYGYGCEIISPLELRQKMLDAAMHLYETYK
ncbi:MAG: WYL domain-containing protein [Clostridia bacterium]|nr:WYL domain-containing protein [Clostridia bacterium]